MKPSGGTQQSGAAVPKTVPPGVVNQYETPSPGLKLKTVKVIVWPGITVVGTALPSTDGGSSHACASTEPAGAADAGRVAAIPIAKVTTSAKKSTPKSFTCLDMLPSSIN